MKDLVNNTNNKLKYMIWIGLNQSLSLAVLRIQIRNLKLPILNCYCTVFLENQHLCWHVIIYSDSDRNFLKKVYAFRIFQSFASRHATPSDQTSDHFYLGEKRIDPFDWRPNDHLWSLVTTYDYLLLLVISTCDHLWLHICDNLWPLETTRDHFWSLVTTYDLWLLVTTCDYLWQLGTTWDYLWLLVTVTW